MPEGIVPLHQTPRPDGLAVDTSIAGSLRLKHAKGGRLPQAVPDFGGLAVATALFDWLREDAAWLNTVLAVQQREREETDPHSAAIWEETDEGRKAINLANERVAQGLKPKNLHAAGWEE